MTLPRAERLCTTGRGATLWRIHGGREAIDGLSSAFTEGDLLLVTKGAEARLLKVVEIRHDGTIRTIRGCRRHIR